MLLSVFDAWDRLTELPDHWRAARKEWAIWVPLVIAAVLFLILESVWHSMTKRVASSLNEETSVPSARPTL